MGNFSAKEAKSDERVLKIAETIDEFEGYRNRHAARIAVLSNAVAQKFNLGSFDRFSLRQAALVHDIGEAVMNRNTLKPVENYTKTNISICSVIRLSASRKQQNAVLIALFNCWFAGTTNGGTASATRML